MRLVSPISRLYIRGLLPRQSEGTLELLLHYQSQGTLELLWLTLRKSDVSDMQREGYETAGHHNFNNKQNMNMCVRVCDGLGVCVWGCVCWSNGVTCISIMRSTVDQV